MAVPHLAAWAPDTPLPAAGCFILSPFARPQRVMCFRIPGADSRKMGSKFGYWREQIRGALSGKVSYCVSVH